MGSSRLLNDYKSHLKGRLNIISPVNEPAIYIEGASPTEGDITWKNTEALQIGTWTADDEFVSDEASPTGTFGEVMKLTNAGVVTVSNPQENDNSPGYFQLDTVVGTPPTDDCDNGNEVGRMTIHATQQKMYVCTAQGWRSLNFFDIYNQPYLNQ